MMARNAMYLSWSMSGFVLLAKCSQRRKIVTKSGRVQLIHTQDTVSKQH